MKDLSIIGTSVGLLFGGDLSFIVSMSIYNRFCRYPNFYILFGTLPMITVIMVSCAEGFNSIFLKLGIP
jgi:hypothetical protein